MREYKTRVVQSVQIVLFKIRSQKDSLSSGVRNGHGVDVV